MSDNYGSTQPRVLEVSERSWDSIVYGQSIPPGSSDSMLPGLVSNEKSAEALRASTPSGWAQVGDIISAQDIVAAEASSPSGTIVTSTDYPSDTVGLVAQGSLRAVVNGWVINVKGTQTTGNHNRITLDSMVNVPASRIDSVFLEVWRELITKDSVIYPNGNDDAGTVLPNDLVNPLAGVETTRRVQIKYRIRATQGGIDLAGSPDGLNASVYGQGSAISPSSLGFFKHPTDAGLYRAGNGDQSSRDTLGTVDGYVYAIPMFAVYRRAQSVGFTPDTESTTLYTKGDAKHSDRPDGYLLDVIYADDIVDLRHQIMAPIDGIMAKTFRQAVSGALRTRRGLAKGNSGYVEVPGGSRLTKGEEIGTGATALPLIGTASVGTLIKRAQFCNASVSNPFSIAEYYPGTAWTINTYSAIDLVGISPMKALSVLGAYSSVQEKKVVLGTDIVVALDVDGFMMDVTIPTGSWLIGTTEVVKFQMETASVAGINGTLDVPEKYLVVLDNVNSVYLPVNEEPVYIPGQDLTNTDFLTNEGVVTTSSWRQGINLCLKTTLVTANSTVVMLPSGKMYGYEVLGVKSVQREVSAGVYGAHQSFTITRNVLVTGIEYIIDTISNIDGETSTNVLISLAVKCKSFELSRQGRGVTAVYETKLVAPVYEGGSFFVDTGDKPILAIGAGTQSLSGYINGQAYAYVGTPTSTTRRTLTVGTSLPVMGEASYVDTSYMPTKVKVTISGTVNPTDTILVPVVVASYIESSDSFSLFFKTAGYQGTSSASSTSGSILAEGPAICTSQGSGAIINKVHSPFNDKAMFTTGSQLVTLASGTSFLGNILPGDLFYKESDDVLNAYVVLSVDSAAQITLEGPYRGTTSVGAGDHFASVRKDTPEGSVYGIIDRLPSRSEDGYLGESVPVSSLSSGPLSVSKRVALQDPMDARKGGVTLGFGTQATRGRVGTQLVASEPGVFNLPYPVPALVYEGTAQYVSYKKVYQGYLFNENDTGRLLMAVLSTESEQGTTNNALIATSLVDVVDTFELVGRPLIMNG